LVVLMLQELVSRLSFETGISVLVVITGSISFAPAPPLVRVMKLVHLHGAVKKGRRSQRRESSAVAWVESQCFTRQKTRRPSKSEQLAFSVL